EMQLIFIPEAGDSQEMAGLQSFSKEEFLDTLPSYSAEQMSLNMIVWFLVVISGMLFAIFFYMMNFQKIGLYCILNAIALIKSSRFKMMWTKILLIIFLSLFLSVAFSQVFNLVASEGMPFHLTVGTTIQLSIIFLIIGFMGSTLSGVQIKRIEPLPAIQQGDV